MERGPEGVAGRGGAALEISTGIRADVESCQTRPHDNGPRSGLQIRGLTPILLLQVNLYVGLPDATLSKRHGREIHVDSRVPSGLQEFANPTPDQFCVWMRPHNDLMERESVPARIED